MNLSHCICIFHTVQCVCVYIYQGINLNGEGASTDMMKATALSYKRDITDIYSNSWGPPDNGKIVGGPGTLTKRVLREGVIEVSNP